MFVSSRRITPATQFSDCLHLSSANLSLRMGGLRSILLALGIGLAAMHALAQTTYTVTDLTDSATDTGSIRYAVNQVDAGGGGDTIVFSGAGAAGVITLTNGSLTISQSVTITGPGANLLTISGGGAVTVLTISSAATVSISGLTISNGASSISGGGVLNSGALTVSNSTFSGNSTSSGNGGGGIYNGGALTVSNSTFSGNSAGAGLGGGGVYNAGTATVSNSTFSGNSGNYGGGLLSRGALTVSNATISGNSAVNGGGIFNSSTLTVTNSIVAGNTDSGSGQAGEDCYSCGAQSAANLISTSSTIINPLLGPLQYNGGPTQTMMPQPNSPAINAGVSSTLPTDQRGFPRPTGAGEASDLGAVQVGGLTVTTTADSTDDTALCDGSDACSLRDALTLANSQGAGDIILSVTGTISLGSALPAIAASVNVSGPGAKLLTVSGNDSATVGSVFTINSGGAASLSGLTIANGNGGSNGGGLSNFNGVVTVSDCTISSNSSNAGGGIYNQGTLTVSNSTLSGNSSVNGSGGGGIFSNGALTMSNSTLSGNTSVNAGGGIYNQGALTVSNSTLSGNTSVNGSGGGIFNHGATVSMSNSIVAGNTESSSGQAGEDCYQCGAQSADNLISTTASPVTAAQLLLGPLAYNGPSQTVQTLLPLPGSPAIEAGLGSTLSADQRGQPRPTGAGVVSDLGAVQTHYTAVQFLQQPANTPVGVGITPAVTLSVIEGGAPALSIPVPVTLAGNGALSGTDTETTATSGNIALASYGNLSVNAVGADDTLNVNLIITPAGAPKSLTLTAASSTFSVFLPTPTLTFTPAPPVSVVYGAAPIALNATSNVAGPTISFVVDAGPAKVVGNMLSFTGAGTVVVQATSPATDSYAAADVIAYITVTPATTTTTLTASAPSIVAGASETLTATVKSGSAAVTSGTVTFASGATSIGAAAVNAQGVATLSTTNLPVGTDSVTASFVPSVNYTASASLAVTVTVAPLAAIPPVTTTTSLVSSSSVITVGQSVTLTATVKAGGIPVSSGTVTFASGGTSIGAAMVSASGVATLTTTNLPVGTDSVTASFVASATAAASTSAAVTVTENAATNAPTSSVTLTAASAALSVAAGSSATDLLTFTSVGGYTGTLKYDCAGLPTGTTCSFFPATLTIGASAGAQTATLTVQTTGATAARALRAVGPEAGGSPFGKLPLLATAFWIPGWWIVAITGSKKKLSSRIRHVLILLLLLSGVRTMTACGGSSSMTPSPTAPTTPATPAGTSTVQVVVTGTGNLSPQVLTFNLTVQ